MKDIATCPRCGQKDFLLAMSRTDDKTNVCSMCGMTEALEVTFDALRPQTAWAVPVLPYNGSSGHSGSQTSKDRADSEDNSGVTGQRHEETLLFLLTRDMIGATWRELSDHYGWHHGQSSGALSVLHKVGFIERLTETRERSAVYVLPQYVMGRETSPYQARKKLSPETIVSRYQLILLAKLDEIAGRDEYQFVGYPDFYRELRATIIETTFPADED